MEWQGERRFCSTISLISAQSQSAKYTWDTVIVGPLFASFVDHSLGYHWILLENWLLYTSKESI